MMYLELEPSHVRAEGCNGKLEIQGRQQALHKKRYISTCIFANMPSVGQAKDNRDCIDQQIFKNKSPVIFTNF